MLESLAGVRSETVRKFEFKENAVRRAVCGHSTKGGFFCLAVLFLFFVFWPHRASCRILVPRPGIEPTPPVVEAWSLNRWTARDVPAVF